MSISRHCPRDGVEASTVETCIFQPCHTQQNPSRSQGVSSAQMMVGREHNFPCYVKQRVSS